MNDNRKEPHFKMLMKCGSSLLLIIRLGKFALCNFLSFGKDLIVNLLGRKAIKNIYASQQVEVFGKVCDGVCIDL